ncbi:glutamate--tRNA ligase [Ferroplasma sp.]|uniref:glutamate--tRNA ligase n=1 Tax=Ferroplasma sp. TaxID=2591003 RepID=UPI00307D5DD3
MQQEIRKQVIKNAYLHGGKADISSVVGKLISINPDVKKDMKNVMALIRQEVENVNAMTYEQISSIVNIEFPDILIKEKKEEKHELPDLPNVNGEVVMRMAPSPSGPLHIGHSRMAILNDEYVKRYGGKLILRIEDTNPENIDPDAYDLIPEDLKWLGVNVTETVIQSSRMEFYYSEAKRMISEGYMYVIEENQQEFHDLKLKKIPVKERNADPEANLEKFEKMLSGYYSDGEAALVMKTDINHPNPSIRDWIAFRINSHEHPLTGNKYCVYPTMNFSVSIDDHYLGLTHVIRGIDHLVNTEKQKYVFKYNNWKIPEYFHYGFITIPDTVLKTTIIKKGIRAGEYSGWDDIRLGTILALKKRGYSPETFRKYWVNSGMNKSNATFSWEIFNSIDRDIRDFNTERYFFVPDPVLINLKNPEPIKSHAMIHPQRPELGYREYILEKNANIYLPEEDLKTINEGEIIRVKDLCVAVKTNGSPVYSNEEPSKRVKIIQWAPENSNNIEILYPDGTTVPGKIEPLAMKKHKVVQLERYGYVNLDGTKGYFLYK